MKPQATTMRSATASPVDKESLCGPKRWLNVQAVTDYCSPNGRRGKIW
jgi:hypothetical protein